jgi:glyceraldehyde 3-phosphate dehydrogenase
MNRKIRIAVNGFGRIGRYFSKLALAESKIELVAVNDLADINTLKHLFKYDSIHGRLPYSIHSNENSLSIHGQEIQFFNEKDPSKLPWKELEVDIVIESTGLFRTYESAYQHVAAGAKKVILSAPPSDDSIKSVVLGINDDILDNDDLIISNASCTTNSAAPLVKVIKELTRIQSTFVTTVHSYTTDQRLHDAPHKDLRRARAAAQSIVPTTTGAAKALTKIFPELPHLGGCGIRVPVPDGSLTDMTFAVDKSPSVEEINDAFKYAADNNLKGILEYTEDPIVSVDVLGNPHSSIFDAQLTSVIGNMIKVVGWYDNEAGYSNRLIELSLLMSK